MSLDATLTMLIAEATPAVQVALREVARRAYETGYREALASAHRAGVAAEPAAPLPLTAPQVVPSLLPRTEVSEAPPSAPDPAVALPKPYAVPIPTWRDDDVEEEDAPPSVIAPVFFSAIEDDEDDEDDDAPGPEEEEVGEDGADAERSEAVIAVEKAVRAGQGLAVSEIARLTSIPIGWVGRALRTLKKEGRIAQGGDRRFARYAAEHATALQASLAARGKSRDDGEEVESARAPSARTRRVLEITPVRPTLTIGALRARIVKQLGLERFAIDVVICKRGDATRRQIRGDLMLRPYLIEE